MICIKKDFYSFDLSKNGFSLIGLLLSLLIMAFLYYIIMNAYVKRSTQGEPEAVSNPKATLDRAREAVGEINKRQLDRSKQY